MPVTAENKISLDEKLFSRVVKLMGNRFEFTVVSDDETAAEHFIDKAIEEVKRIERLFTTFNDDSQVNLINKFAGIKPVVVDPEIVQLINRSVKISELTDGAFDITYGSIDKSLWNFDLNMKELPDPEIAKSMVSKINFRNVLVDKEHNSVFLKEPGMRIGFGGIGKGYAADRAKKILMDCGVKNGIVNAAGDLVTWGNQPDGKPWTAGISDPYLKTKAFSYLEISDMAIATSGNYEKHVTIGGKRYSHTIDPKTGMPVSGIKSVTIISPIAEIADAMATPVMVMGVKVGLELINQIKNIACVIVDDNDHIHTSKNINIVQ